MYRRDAVFRKGAHVWYGLDRSLLNCSWLGRGNVVMAWVATVYCVLPTYTLRISRAFARFLEQVPVLSQPRDPSLFLQKSYHLQ
jgi:hypothetical protein